MKLSYYPETDSLYIELKPIPGAETCEITDGIVLDIDATGQAVGIDIQHASARTELVMDAVGLSVLGERDV